MIALPPMSAARAAAKKLVVFGGTGFVGSAIVEEAVRRGLTVTCLTRGGAPPAHVAGKAWSDKVQWHKGDALDPASYETRLVGADAIVTAVGRLPLPSLTHEEVVRDNGETNVTPAKAAKAAGVPRLVVVGASIPPFVPGMAFGVSAAKGVYPAGYAVGKAQAEAYARDEFTDAGTGAGAVVLKPGGVSGTRFVGSAPLPLWMALSPVSMLLKNAPVDAIADLAPVPVENVARAAVAAATEPEFAGRFTEISNLELVRNYGGRE